VLEDRRFDSANSALSASVKAKEQRLHEVWRGFKSETSASAGQTPRRPGTYSTVNVIPKVYKLC
jgi:hypothetical protein